MSLHRSIPVLCLALVALTASGGCSGDASVEASATPSVSATTPALADVTEADLATIEVPAACELPSQRLVAGATTEGGPGSGELATDGAKPWAAYADFAGLGYRQALVVYQCNAGGIGWPQVLVLAGAGGSLLGSFDLGSLASKDHATVSALAADGSEAKIAWSAYDGAGSAKQDFQGVVTVAGGTLTVTVDKSAQTLSVPDSQIIDVSSGSLVGFASPSGRLLCSIDADLAGCHGSNLDAAKSVDEVAYCQTDAIGIAGVAVDTKAGWYCAGGLAFGGSAGEELWWTGRGWPRTEDPTVGIAPVLPYGWGLRHGDLVCVMQETGVTCQNTATGATFTGNATETTFSGPTHVTARD